MPKITKMFAFVIEDKGPDDEGVPAAMSPDGKWMPLMGADLTRIESLKPIAQQMADQAQKPIRIVEFSVREDVGLITPSPKQ
jgi:hypothetical protein